MAMQRRIVWGCLSIWLVSLCSAQPAPPAGLPEFEAAAIRVNQSGDPQSGGYDPGGQFIVRGATLRMLIGIGWKETHTVPDLTPLEIAVAPSVAQFNSDRYLKGAPSWLNTDCFDVIAKAAVGTPMDTVRLMVQKLLADRFHLVVHREEKSVKVWAMVSAKGGFKLQRAEGGEAVCAPSISNDNVYHRDCRNMSMARLAEQLPNFAPRFFEGRPVVDATGLTGVWNFRLDWTPLSGGLTGLGAGPDQEFDSGRTIFGTMEKNLGIKLESREQPVPVIVIDSVDRTPGEN